MRSGDNNTKELRNELLNQWNQTGNDLMDCLIDSMIDVKQLQMQRVVLLVTKSIFDIMK